MSVVPRQATRRQTDGTEQPSGPAPQDGHMVVCGDDALAHRIAAELAEVYRRSVVLVAPAAGGPDTSDPAYDSSTPSRPRPTSRP